MNKRPVMSAQDFYNSLLRYGCVPVKTRGSHFVTENPKNGKRAPVPVHSGNDINRGFMQRILSELGIDIDDFMDSI